MNPGTKVHILTPITRERIPGVYEVRERPKFLPLPAGLVWVLRIDGDMAGRNNWVRVAKSRLEVCT